MTTDLVLVGRSSSHFTRTARIFALELGVAHTFRPVLDLTSPDPATYADNPALKVPVLLDGDGPLFGTENICRALARRAALRPRVVLRGDVEERLVANVEEMTLHVMSAEVTLITMGATPHTPRSGLLTAGMAGGAGAIPPKVRHSLENGLAYLDASVDRMLEALPADRALSFVETALFCTVTHLPFRKVADVSGYARLAAFSQRFGERESARLTEYRFDAA